MPDSFHETRANVRARASKMHCLDCMAHLHSACAWCSAPELEFLNRLKTYRTFGHGREILAEGVRAAFLGTITEGMASMWRLLPDGRRQIVALLFPGDLVGRPLRACLRRPLTAA